MTVDLLIVIKRKFLYFSIKVKIESVQYSTSHGTFVRNLSIRHKIALNTIKIRD